METVKWGQANVPVDKDGNVLTNVAEDDERIAGMEERDKRLNGPLQAFCETEEEKAGGLSKWLGDELFHSNYTV